jgi:glycosyltransferase involved in cell wall biosynthesis
MKTPSDNPAGLIFNRKLLPIDKAFVPVAGSNLRRYAKVQAIGLPLVCTHRGPEIVWNRRTGLLVPERSIQYWAQNILLSLLDSGLCCGMASAARANVCCNFNFRFQTPKLENYLSMGLRDRAKVGAGQ